MIKMHSTTFNYFFAILLFALVISSCASKKKQPFGRNTKLENKRWVLRELNGKPTNTFVFKKEITLKIESGDNTFGGNGPCNTMNGMYVVQEEMIKFQSMASTEMACDALDIESEYFGMLQICDSYRYETIREKGAGKEYLLLFKDQKLVGKFEAVWLQ
jgi:heat shock protein HslJ